MLKGNKGEWSEPYVLLKLLADGKLFLGDENFEKVESVFYPIIQVIKHEKSRSIDFSIHNNLVIVSDGLAQFQISISEFVDKAKYCFEKITSSKSKTGSFAIPKIQAFFKYPSMRMNCSAQLCLQGYPLKDKLTSGHFHALS